MTDSEKLNKIYRLLFHYADDISDEQLDKGIDELSIIEIHELIHEIYELMCKIKQIIKEGE